ncbi:hypothetical protein GCM10009775_13230 [Microbacterium aoyamense]|uniref:SbsA Ig-like domain-containing protein n=1 Tax=Microbacterium aoyamense TaxID=344166 RepID=A0ABN2PIT9_9MICO|nr:hypothetical protein [Microbacterium aoyamense]
MSTEPTTRRGAAGSRRERDRARRRRAYLRGFGIVLGALAVIGAGAAAVGVVQGPRVTAVQVDPAAATVSSGARLIVTTSQALADVDPAQVTVDPAVPFTVDTSGRSVGVRFTQPLWDETQYTVSIADVTGTGGGATATIVESFTTPAVDFHLLQRGGADGDGDGDTVLRADLAGETLPIFTSSHIEDFRATASHLVMSVRTDEDEASLIVSGPSGGGIRPLPLPGSGFVSNLQAADRGEVIGYTFSDADLGADGGLESALFTASLAAGASDADPTPIVVEGADPRVAEWRFVPDTDSILLLGFDGTLMLTGSTGGAGTSLGTALAIEGVAGTDAIVERLEGMVVIDLTDGSEQPLVAADGEESLGTLRSVLPVAGGGTLRTYGRFDDTGLVSEGTSVAFVSDDGTVSDVSDVPVEDALVQVCASPSGRYAAVLVAPSAVDNPYDTYQLPLPETLETRIVQISDGAPVETVSGFDISWCRVPPQ